MIIHNNTYNPNELLLDVIIAALKGYVATNGKGLDNDSEEARKSGTINFSYLLGQSIRQWQIPEENWHTSVAAMDVWRLLVDEKYNGRIIKDNKGKICGYKEKLSKRTSIQIPRFTGTTKDFSKITVDDVDRNNTKQYVFNDIFIAEHTTPVSDIKDALEICYLEFKNNNKSDSDLKDAVRNILNKIHITQILKIEDRRINNCSSRIKEIKTVNDKIKQIESGAKDQIKEESKGKSKKEKKEIRKRIENEKTITIKGVLYTYFTEDNNDVYDDLCRACYHDLKFDEKKRPNNKSYKAALEIAATNTWAKAVELESHEPYYTIKIYENGTNKELL
jgi:hypothetical protein